MPSTETRLDRLEARLLLLAGFVITESEMNPVVDRRSEKYIQLRAHVAQMLLALMDEAETGK
jgi:hypothetical protein